MHYGFVGRAAGFHLDELIWGSDIAQMADTGEGDDGRDPEAITEGYRLYGRKSGGVTWEDLTAIMERHGAGWGRVMAARGSE